MSLEASSTGYDRLNNIMISLGMEISDSILSALRHEVEACRQEQKEQLALVGPILLGIEAVVRHIDEIRTMTDARAFGLLNELIQDYRVITEEQHDSNHALDIASEALNKVFAWQHSCIQESLQKPQVRKDASPTHSESSSFNIKDLLGTVRQEIAATGMLAIKESAALLEMVHVQKEEERTGDVEEYQGPKKKDFNAIVQENISSLQQALHQEMGRLRHDFIGD